MSEELTRGQFKSLLLDVADRAIQEDYPLMVSSLLDAYDALRSKVEALEKPRLGMADLAVIEYLENEVEQLWPMLGVESAFVTDLSQVGDFPDEQLGAEKYIWQAAIDLLRNHLAQLRVQLAAVTTERDRLKEALEELYTYQNGCPLPSYEYGWTKAMEMTEAALRGEPGGG